MATGVQWARGYARQADADFQTFQMLEALEPPHVPACHRLQFLQMACEKLVKAHLCGEGVKPETLQRSHAVIAANLPRVLKATAVAINLKGSHAREIIRCAKHLAREIEVLAPAVKRDEGRPDNCEYPWADANGDLHVPLDWSFVPSQLLLTKSAPAVLKLIRLTISRLLEEAAPVA